MCIVVHIFLEFALLRQMASGVGHFQIDFQCGAGFQHAVLPERLWLTFKSGIVPCTSSLRKCQKRSNCVSDVAARHCSGRILDGWLLARQLATLEALTRQLSSVS